HFAVIFFDFKISLVENLCSWASLVWTLCATVKTGRRTFWQLTFVKRCLWASLDHSFFLGPTTGAPVGIELKTGRLESRMSTGFLKHRITLSGKYSKARPRNC